MNFHQFELLVSNSRLLRFKSACRFNKKKTLRLYRLNIRLSQAFLATMSIFEIVLRNKIDSHYRMKFPSTENGKGWLFDSVNFGGFFTSPNCRRTKDKIKQACDDLGVSFSHDKLISELSFGTWKFMFAGNQFQAGGSTLLEIFPRIPIQINQSVVYEKLNQINSIRNRVAHYEPICFGIGNTVNTQYVRTRFQHIVDLVDWMGLDSKQLFYGINKVLKEADLIDAVL